MTLPVGGVLSFILNISPSENNFYQKRNNNFIDAELITTKTKASQSNMRVLNN